MTAGHAYHHVHKAAEPDAAAACASGAARYADFTRDMHTSMQRMWIDMHRDPPSGDPDIDFLTLMIPHHWGAVEMARLVLACGREPLVRALAEELIAVQSSEMEGMRGRLAALRSEQDRDSTFPLPTANRGPG